MEGYYQILNLQPTATQEEIDRRYRFLVKAYHPDRFQSKDEKTAATEEMKRINSAYTVLRDPIKRAEYDRNRNNQTRQSSEETFSSEQAAGPDPKQMDYLDILLDKWQHLVANYQHDDIQEKLIAQIIASIRTLIEWAEPQESAAQFNQYQEKFALVSALFGMFNLALGAEEVSSGLPADFSREDLLRLARAPFEYEVATLVRQAIYVGLVTQAKLSVEVTFLLSAIRSLQTKYVEAGRACVERTKANESSKAHSQTQYPPFRQPPSHSSASTSFRSTTNEKLGYCASCFNYTHVSNFSFHRNTGFLIFRQYRKVEGPLCADCAEHYFWSFTGHNLLFGWWGMISFIVTPFLILFNIISFLSGSELRKYSSGFNNNAVGWKIIVILILIFASLYGVINLDSFITYNSPQHRPTSAYVISEQEIVPTKTLIHTQKREPTSTPVRTRKPSSFASTSTDDGCLKWNEVKASHEKKKLCVKGIILNAYQAQETYFITFSENKDAFRFLVSYGYFTDLKRGDCVKGEGIVELYGEMPYIKLKEIYIGPSSLCN